MVAGPGSRSRLHAGGVSPLPAAEPDHTPGLFLRRVRQKGRFMSGCDHPGFKAMVSVGRLTDESREVGSYTAEVHVECAACGLPFEFVGMPFGVHPARPTMSPDALEARLPIQPQKRPGGPLWSPPRLVSTND